MIFVAITKWFLVEKSKRIFRSPAIFIMFSRTVFELPLSKIKSTIAKTTKHKQIKNKQQKRGVVQPNIFRVSQKKQPQYDKAFNTYLSRTCSGTKLQCLSFFLDKPQFEVFAWFLCIIWVDVRILQEPPFQTPWRSTL